MWVALSAAPPEKTLTFGAFFYLMKMLEYFVEEWRDDAVWMPTFDFELKAVDEDADVNEHIRGNVSMVIVKPDGNSACAHTLKGRECLAVWPGLA